jgi:hypothetical protein
MARAVDVANVFESPALPLLLELEMAGLVVVTETGGLRIRPTNRLSPAQLAAVQEHRDALKTLALICDVGVQARRTAFVERLAVAETALVPTLVYRPDVPYVVGQCFSCGEPNGRTSFGRCWRCSLAWRLAVRAQVPVDAAMAYDEARSA